MVNSPRDDLVGCVITVSLILHCIIKTDYVEMLQLNAPFSITSNNASMHVGLPQLFYMGYRSVFSMFPRGSQAFRYLP
jgi:hypothetical protein